MSKPRKLFQGPNDAIAALHLFIGTKPADPGSQDPKPISLSDLIGDRRRKRSSRQQRIEAEREPGEDFDGRKPVETADEPEADPLADNPVLSKLHDMMLEQAAEIIDAVTLVLADVGLEDEEAIAAFVDGPDFPHALGAAGLSSPAIAAVHSLLQEMLRPEPETA